MEASRTILAPATATPRVAIIGAGFTGTLLAVHLLREARAPVVIHLFEQHGWFGRGVAYSTGNPSHLLNVRVANMSAFPDDPADFLLWLWRFDYHVDGLPIPPSGHAFVPRTPNVAGGPCPKPNGVASYATSVRTGKFTAIGWLPRRQSGFGVPSGGDSFSAAKAG